MSLKTFFAIKTAKLTSGLLTIMGKKATSLPGKIALNIDGNILREIGSDYRVIVVTGTNGKTQTTAFIRNILMQKYDNVISNVEGANLIQGIVTLFLNNYKKNSSKEKFAVLEVDEATVKYVTEHIDPEAVVLTNVFIDQTERFADIGVTFDKILEGIAKTKKAKVVINADCPVFLSKNIENETIFYGFDRNSSKFQNTPDTDDHSCPKCHKPLDYSFVVYSNIGEYRCDCGFKRPELKYKVTKINELSNSHSNFEIDNCPFNLNRGGIYNIYNALSAYSCVKLLNIDKETIQKGFDDTKQIFGRQMNIKIDNKDVAIYLIKNPTGANQIFGLLEFYKEPFDLVTLLNNNAADGVNFKWIETAKFEKLVETNTNEIFLGGVQKLELKKRFENAGFTKELKLIENNTTDIINIIKNSKQKNVVVLASYTCLTELENHLKSINYV